MNMSAICARMALHNMITRHYKVAGHTFAVSGQAEFFELMGKYEPFECEGGKPLFSLTADCGVVPEYTEVFQQGEGLKCFNRGRGCVSRAAMMLLETTCLKRIERNQRVV